MSRQKLTDRTTRKIMAERLPLTEDGSDTTFPTKDVLINEIKTPKNSNSGSANERVYPADQSYINIKDYYINLDSWSKNIPDSNLAMGTLAYSLFSYFNDYSSLRDKFGLDEELVRVYELKLFQFTIPEVVVPPNLFAFDRVFIEIKNITRNCIYIRNIGKYHFTCSVGTPSAGTIELTPIKGQDKIILKHPLYSLDTMIIVLKTPTAVIPLPNDVLQINTLVPATNPAQITSTAHGLTTGDIIYIEGFVSGISSVDLPMNSPYGLSVTVLDPNNFTVPVDASAVVTPVTGFIVYIQKNRIMIPFKLRGLTSDTTQFIIPV